MFKCIGCTGIGFENEKYGLSYMKKFRKNEDAVSPVIGATLMVGLSVIMISMVAVSVFGFALPESAPKAKIVVAEAKGNISNIYIDANTIVLKHKGGDALIKNNTKIIINGMGITYARGQFYLQPAKNIRVAYGDLSGNNYNWAGNKLDEIVKGNTWDAGETITLYGTDGAVSQGNNVDTNWVLNPGSEVRVTIMDLYTNEVIATSTITVNQA